MVVGGDRWLAFGVHTYRYVYLIPMPPKKNEEEIGK